MIEKGARVPAFQRAFAYFGSARAAFAKFLGGRPSGGRKTVALPAYIGWTAREGSGVFDPVRQAKYEPLFYRVDEKLDVDVEDYGRLLKRGNVEGVVLIHYFGRADPAYRELAALAREGGAWILEDEAHALLTDLVSGRTGRIGDASILSLHKLLPVPEGGALITNGEAAATESGDGSMKLAEKLWRFDLSAIAQRRTANAHEWLRVLGGYREWLRPLWGEVSDSVVPQSLPVLVSGCRRDRLYERLNEEGIGVVSLYHTLIEELSPRVYPVSHELSRTILNFPVHQDVTMADIEGAAERLGKALMECRE